MTDNYLLDIIIGIVLACEAWYWIIYFPHAWKNESNEEINNIKRAVSLIYGKGILK